MLINGKEVLMEDLLVNSDLRSYLGKLRSNNLFLSDYQINVLRKNQIDYTKYSSMKELSFGVEEVLNSNYEIDPELEEVASQIDEYRYYNEIRH